MGVSGFRVERVGALDLGVLGFKSLGVQGLGSPKTSDLGNSQPYTLRP